MDKRVHMDIQNEYAARRMDLWEKLQNKKAALYALSPKLQEIEDAIAKMGIRAAKASIEDAGRRKEIQQRLQEEIQKLKDEKTRELEKIGYKEEDLNEEYVCSHCKDTGFIKTGDIYDRCFCYDQMLIKYAYTMSGLDEKKIASFNDFNESAFSEEKDERYSCSPRENINKIKAKCFHFIEQVFDEKDGQNLALFGNTGTGKTFISECVAEALMKKGRTVLYISAPTMFEKMNAYRYGSDEDKIALKELYYYIFQAELLIIDDLGTEASSEAKLSDLLTIINERKTADKKSPHKIIISTNLMLKELANRYDERLVSRIVGGFQKLNFIGGDIRLKGKA